MYRKKKKNNMEQVECEEKVIAINKKKKPVEPGIIYLSRIPTMMNVNIVRRTFERFGETSRIFLQPDVKQASRGKRGRSFSEGWVEFKNKKIAKQVAAALNNTQIGGKKKCKWREELWNMKYLHRFKWAHLNERLAYEKAVHAQRMRTEISQAKREANFYIQNAEKNERQKKMKKKLKGSQKELLDKKDSLDGELYEVKLKDTEDEILEKRKHETDKRDVSSVKKFKQKHEGSSRKHSSTGGRSFLSKIFSGGLDAEDE